MTHHINRIKGITHIIILIDAEKAFVKIPYPFMIKTQQISYRKNIPQHSKGYTWPTANVILNSERLKPFLLRSGIMKESPLSLLPFKTVVEVLARSIGQK